jgi:osmotically-inducible protein OsmY
MKPIISDRMLRDAVVTELERDLEVDATHISVSATSRRSTRSTLRCEQPSGCPR